MRKVILLLLIALTFSACGTVRSYQAKCDRNTSSFRALVDCTEHEVRADIRSKGDTADLVDQYFLAGRVLSDRVERGQMSETEARYEWAALYTEMRNNAIYRGAATRSTPPAGRRIERYP